MKWKYTNEEMPPTLSYVIFANQSNLVYIGYFDSEKKFRMNGGKNPLIENVYCWIYECELTDTLPEVN